MRVLVWLIALSLVLLPVAVLVILFAMFQDFPAIGHGPALTPEKLARAEHILDDNDPRKLKPGSIRTLRIPEADLDMAADYLASRYLGGTARLRLGNDTISLWLTVPVALPGTSFDVYLNTESVLRPSAEGLPIFESLRIGELTVPPGLANALARQALEFANGKAAMQALADTVKLVAVDDDILTVTYRWQSDLLAQLGSAAIPEADRKRLEIYRAKLVEASAGLPKQVSLASLLPPVFQLAAERSAVAGADPIAENRAAIAMLMFYVNQRGLGQLIPAAEPWPGDALRAVTLNGRDDFPKHFMISAAIAAAADTPLADAVGLAKELRDSRGGSGFSFNDIAADRAGARLGEMATASPETARRLQRELAAGPREPDFMPATDGLPEFMPEAEFKARFGGIGEPEYNLMMRDIEDRIANLPLYRRAAMAGTG